MITARSALVAALLVLAAPGWPGGPAAAQQAQGQVQGQGPAPGPLPASDGLRRGGGERAANDNRRLPADSTTRHALDLGDRTLRFTAVAGSIPLTDPQGAVQAEIAFTAYVLDGQEPGRRPVTFAFNGGPGAASAYLHLGAIGPWRLPLDGATLPPSASPALLPNAETWLDFTDLVFVDPVGTGYTRANGSQEDIRGRYLTVEGDIDSLSDFIARWLRANGRHASPKFVIGESYGGFRGPLLAEKLRDEPGVGLSGLVLLSPVLDFGWRSTSGFNPLPRVSLLPSLAAAALERRGPVDRARLAEVEAYAAGEFLTDLLRGLDDGAALDRLSRRVAGYTGLDPDLVRRLAGRVDVRTFQREFERAAGRVVSAYDTGVGAHDPEPNAANSRFEDPLLTPLTPILTSAAVGHTQQTLKWPVDGRYRLLNGGVNGAWRWGSGRSPPEAFTELRQALSLDPRFRVLVAHGFTDLVTPYFESDLLLRQLPAFGREPRARLAVYPGGHMFYSRDGSRIAFRRDALELYRQAEPSTTGAVQDGSRP